MHSGNNDHDVQILYGVDGGIKSGAQQQGVSYHNTAI
jgi:hypothetical protein